ncbi:phage baseplate assembly protein V [Silvimonas sp.]|uniref:phage baseplate assembly protein V n=1 Tax=Silvimonas sp. TaxID=2650811 RepID=UPI00284490B0|nr:phage baseplate assembly protein V [Silvimonas sp.]MDR3429684.1 phage baseplate assembly protein V [Silvimonas sp.]
MNPTQDHARRIESLIRTGTIAAVDRAARPPVCRVKTGGLVTGWLPWFALRAGATRNWSPPTQGEQCAVLSASGETGAGLVLLGLYSDDCPAPSQSADETLTLYPDGATMVYNHATGALAVSGIKTALVQASGHVLVDCPDAETTGNLTVGGDLRVKGSATIEQLLTYLAGLSGSGGATGAKTKISGDFTHGDGQLSSNGVVLDTHDHMDSLHGLTSGPNR